jgi:phosphoglycolate phosphatase-like HAD superfamily hydrolase
MDLKLYNPIMNEPRLLALDFDGVICNGLREYFQTAEEAYLNIWQEPRALEQYRDSFYRIRPVVETGWEMPLLLRALVLGKPEEEIFSQWTQIVKTLLEQEQISPEQIMQEIDNSRDRQIENDLEQWLALHQFYPGIIDKMQQALSQGIQVYIITTKEGRFTQKLLAEAGLKLPSEQIKGKEVKQPKAQTLLHLIESLKYQAEEIWFVEDRLEALQSVQKQDQLRQVKLFLADWGYNLSKAREAAKQDGQINLLSLSQFVSPFTQWPLKEC